MINARATQAISQETATRIQSAVDEVRLQTGDALPDIIELNEEGNFRIHAHALSVDPVLFDQLEPAHARAILCHEAAHVRFHDLDARARLAFVSIGLAPARSAVALHAEDPERFAGFLIHKYGSIRAFEEKARNAHGVINDLFAGLQRRGLSAEASPANLARSWIEDPAIAIEHIDIHRHLSPTPSSDPYASPRTALSFLTDFLGTSRADQERMVREDWPDAQVIDYAAFLPSDPALRQTTHADASLVYRSHIAPLGKAFGDFNALYKIAVKAIEHRADHFAGTHCGFDTTTEALRQTAEISDRLLAPSAEMHDPDDHPSLEERELFLSTSLRAPARPQPSRPKPPKSPALSPAP